jgi:hypothetical protein
MSSRNSASVTDLISSAGDASIGLVARVTRRLWGIAVLLLALLAVGLALLSTAKYGAGLSSDSVAYYDVARSLTAGKGLFLHTGEPFVWWPPLYPTLLALIGSTTGLDPTAFAHLVNAVLFALVICLSASLFRTAFRRDTAFALLGTGAVLFSLPISLVYTTAWSECLFIPLTLLYLVFAQRYWDRHDIWSLAAMALSVALACLTRYIGAALVLAGAVTVLVATGVNMRRRITRALTFAATSLLPIGLWAMRNYRLTGTFFGHRGPLQNRLVDALTYGAHAVLSWYVPFSPGVTSPGFTAELAVVLAAALGLVLVLLLSSARRARLLRSLRSVLSSHTPAVLFVVVFTVGLLASALRDANVDSRTLSPSYVPLSMVILALVYDLLSSTRPVSMVAADRVPSILLGVWLCLSATNVTLAATRRFRDGAGGLNSTKWRENKTVNHVKQMLRGSDGVRVYSNATDVLWGLAGVDALPLPSRRTVALSELPGRWPPESVSVVVWLEGRRLREQHFSPKELGEIARLEPVAQFSDGAVYRVSARNAAMASGQ